MIHLKCGVRKWRVSDKFDLAEVANNRNVLNNLRDGIPFPYTADDAEWYINQMLSADENSTFAFAITLDDRVIGSIGAFRQDNIYSRTAELGYYIGEKYWGHGYTTEAVMQICDYVFANTDIIRIFAEPFAYNTASCRVLEKCGFALEGIMRANAVKNGKTLDMALYAIIKSEI